MREKAEARFFKLLGILLLVGWASVVNWKNAFADLNPTGTVIRQIFDGASGRFGKYRIIFDGTAANSYAVFGSSQAPQDNAAGAVLMSSGSFVAQSTSATAGYKFVEFLNNAGTEVLSVNQAGNAAVSGMLAASGATQPATLGAKIGGDGTNGLLYFTNAVGTYITGYIDANTLRLNTQSNANIITGTGLVGVGTASPCSTCTLHVVGNGAFTGTVQVGASGVVFNDGTSQTSAAQVEISTAMIVAAGNATASGVYTVGISSTATMAVASGKCVEFCYNGVLSNDTLNAGAGWTATYGLNGTNAQFLPGFSPTVGIFDGGERVAGDPILATKCWTSLPGQIAAGNYVFALMIRTVGGGNASTCTSTNFNSAGGKCQFKARVISCS